jgi:hypothetical protein
VRDKTGDYVTFTDAVREAVETYLPGLEPALEGIIDYLALYFQVFPEERRPIRTNAAAVPEKPPEAPKPEPTVESLIAALKDDDKGVRQQAVAALVKIGESAVAPLIAAFKEGDERVQQQALAALVKIGEPAVAPLIAALKEGDERVQQQALAALAKIGEPAVAPLTAALWERTAAPTSERPEVATASVTVHYPHKPCGVRELRDGALCHCDSDTALFIHVPDELRGMQFVATPIKSRGAAYKITAKKSETFWLLVFRVSDNPELEVLEEAGWKRQDNAYIMKLSQSTWVQTAVTPGGTGFLHIIGLIYKIQAEAGRSYQIPGDDVLPYVLVVPEIEFG